MSDHDELTPLGRMHVLAAAFLGWLCAGLQMGLVPITSRPAAIDLLLGRATPTGAEEILVGQWFAWYLAAFLLGGAAGGLLFGWVGDGAGRVRAIGLSILCFSLGTGLSWFVGTAEELLVLRFITGLGIGGMWTGGVTLASEGWPAASRPVIAGLVGTAANVGIVIMALVGQVIAVTPETWRQVSLIAAGPSIIGVWVLLAVPESPRWLQERAQRTTTSAPVSEVFRPPLLWRVLLGIGLGTVPLLGTWGSGKWLMPWAEQHGANASLTQLIWASGAVLGSLSGGWLASQFGRRTVYFVVTLTTLIINVVIYRYLDPRYPQFLPAAFLLGLSATVFFGWLPLYLPELFPTHVRATGAGVSFNAGRIATAAGVLGTGMLVGLFDGNYARVGEVSAWVYALGLVLILFAPDTSAKDEP